MKVFLSHTSSDKDLVELVYKKLDTENAWYDAVDIENGDCIPEKITEGLQFATHYVLFWSKKASESGWVGAELNAAFMQTMEDMCKFMIFTLDDTPLPILIQPYKFDNISKQNLEEASNLVTQRILSEEGVRTRISQFVGRTTELGDIADSVRDGYKLIILHGMLGIGKLTLAQKEIRYLYSNRAMKTILVDFNTIPGMAELAIELSYKTKLDLINENYSLEEQKSNIQYFLEKISERQIVLILKDVKNWLNEDGTMGDNLLFITDLIVKTEMFSTITIMTSSRFVDMPNQYLEFVREIPVGGMEDRHIQDIIRNNLPKTFHIDEKKNYEFAKRLYGYPLGAKLGAYRIANHGYDYYLQQPEKIQKLQISLAKDLISYADLSPECFHYLKIVALCRSRLRNDEYISIFPEFTDSIAQLAEEAFFNGILVYRDGYYVLERLVEDFFYDKAFNDQKCGHYCSQIEKYLLKRLEYQDGDYMRLVPLAIHILTLNGHIDKAMEIRRELTATVTCSMWDLYNHSEYDGAYKVAEQLIRFDSDNIEAKYMKSLCLIRFEEYGEARKILSNLRDEDIENEARYYNALGRIEKLGGAYDQAIEMFQIAIIKKRKYISPYRELAECYLLMNDINAAKREIEKAKQIDDSNIFVILLEARILQKENHADKAIDLLNNQSLFEREPAQILFRKGRAYDQLGKKDKAKKCYEQSLDHNPKTYDAQLCLLSHKIIDDPMNANREINELRGKLRGKRKYILENIEARYVGYQNHDEERALEILDKVPKTYRDRQWCAVKKQLLEKLIEKSNRSHRETLENIYKQELEKLCNYIKEKYGDITLNETDLLPDT